MLRVMPSRLCSSLAAFPAGGSCVHRPVLWSVKCYKGGLKITQEKREKNRKSDTAKHFEVQFYPEDGWNVEKILVIIRKHSSVDVYVIALHDKDVNDDGSPEKPHYHVYIHFGNGTSWKKSNIAKWFDIPDRLVQFIQCDPECKNPRQSMYTVINYYTHRNCPDKHLYSPDDFVSNINVREYLENEQNKAALRANKMMKQSAVDDLINRCANGEIQRFNYCDFISPTIFAKYAQQFERAFKFADDQYLISHENSRNCKIIWIWGKTGVGKTRIANLFAKQLNKAAYTTDPGNDPFNHYLGQPIIIMDEIRPFKQSEYPDLLKILDPHHLTAIHARYRDVIPHADIIFVTTIFSPVAFCDELGLLKSSAEPPSQLYRRLSEVWELTRENITATQFNQDANSFEVIWKRANPVTHFIEAQSKEAPPQADSFDVLDAVLDAYTPGDSDGQQLSIFSDVPSTPSAGNGGYLNF